MTALQAHSIKQDGRAPAPRVPFPCALQDLDLQKLAGRRRRKGMRKDEGSVSFSHAAPQLPVSDLAEPILPCATAPEFLPRTSLFLPP